jgi:hypothetical protein
MCDSPLCGTCGGRQFQHSPREGGTAGVEDLAVGQRPGRAGALIVERQLDAGAAVHHLGVRGGRGELVHRAALVGLQVREGDPPEPAGRHDLLDRPLDQREQLALAGVVEQRLLGVDEERVEGEAARPDVRDPGRQPVDAVGDLVDFGSHRAPSSLSGPGRCGARG